MVLLMVLLQFCLIARRLGFYFAGELTRDEQHVQALAPRGLGVKGVDRSQRLRDVPATCATVTAMGAMTHEVVDCPVVGFCVCVHYVLLWLGGDGRCVIRYFKPLRSVS
jgi:hypothetical protein